MLRALRPSPLFAILVLIWLVGMSWRLYPRFVDTVRVDGRLESSDAYVQDTCGERIGDVAATCLAEARANAKRMVCAERWRVALFILAPLLIYVAIYLPARLFIALVARARVRA